VSAAGFISITPEAEKLILSCARVSSDQSNESVGLIKYLIRNKHWSPFEMAGAVAEIRTSRTIAHQILRHRSFSFQEFSQRYAQATNVIIYQGRTQATENRQSSVDDLSQNTQLWWVNAQKDIHKKSTELYREAIKRGIAKECARFVLPEATETKLYMSGTIRSWIHYFDLRCDEHTQLEHREIALELREDLTESLPTIAEALGWTT
jgi:thymidylate synthase (FAD)